MTLVRTVVITGGGKGIGAELTRVFYENGDRVVIASRGDSGLASTLGDRARYLHCDVRVPNELKQVAQAALAWSGRVDVWVNNAGRDRKSVV